jgi:hypothetical protein
MQIDGKEKELVELSLQSCRCLSRLVFLFLHLPNQRTATIVVLVSFKQQDHRKLSACRATTWL